MNKFVWILMLPFLLPFMVIGFLGGWAVVGIAIGVQFVKELGDWIGE